MINFETFHLICVCMKLRAPFLLLFLISGCLHSLQAQLCNGSLGDPVVHITFGSGSGAGPALPANVTSYTYTTSSCPIDGSYSLQNLSFGCFGGSWHTLSGDHTPGDGNGYYMLVNASNTPGDFYVDTIRGLCPNTSYEFATWVKNVLKPDACSFNGIKPNLTFNIETTTGTIITTFNSGDIRSEDPAVWRQYGTYFQTPVGISDVVIRLRNNAPGGCGNDLALDDITFRPCGPQVTAEVGTTDSSEYFACESDHRDLLLNTSFSPGIYANPSFQWQFSPNGTTWTNIPGATTPSYLHKASPVGSYFYRMLIADGGNINSVSCRLSSNIISITVSQPVAQVTNYVFGCYGSDIGFYAAGGSFYSWTGPAGFTSTAQGPKLKNVQFNNSGWYKVVVTDYRGCRDEDSTNLIVYPAATITSGPDLNICEGAPATLSATGGTRYYWTTPAGILVDSIRTPVVKPTDSTYYNVLVFNEYGCFDTTHQKVNVWKKPLVNAGPDQKTRLGYAAQLSGSIKGTDIRYYWTPLNDLDNPGSLRPRVNPPQSQNYTLHAESLRGCGVTSDDVFVKVYDKVLVPNAFSPNGDGINDNWVIEPLEFFTEAVTTVYNRYGQIVFTIKGYPKPWDGTRNGNPLPVGTYYYIIDLKTNREPLLTGSVTIIR